MKKLIAAALFAVISATAFAQSQPFHVYNRLRVGYDDNIYSASKDEKSSLRLVEEVEVKLNLALERLYVGIDYRPSLLWIPERDDNETDFLHDLTGSLSLALTPQLVFSFKDTLRASQLPELENDGYYVRADDDNIVNTALATLAYNILPQTRIDLSGRYSILHYSEDAHDADNYWMVVGGASLRQQLASHTTVFGDFRYQLLRYPDAPDELDRDSDALYAGIGFEQTFSEQLIGSLRGGVQNRQYDNDKFDDNTKPYIDASLTIMPTPDTRFTLSGGYSISESDVTAYASQDRYTLALNLAHDFSNKLTVYANGQVAFGKYEADYAYEDLENHYQDDDETTYSAGARISYKLLQNNWLELGYTFTKIDSDVYGRSDYDRNRVDLGWKIQLF
ncbi:MAG: outer membrane beta-barrel protein [Kiritimatiellae bacterium]|nr:outer membrane beta-barrel protein [Kiritimatiellia bacterium]MBR4252829.1 outer membrane beta-barrel protein [Kiritimatiellia bacterium]